MNNEELKIFISAEISKLKSELEKGKKEVDDFSKKSKSSFEEFQEGVSKANDTCGKAMQAIGVAVAGAVTALLALTASTEEYRTNQAKLNTAFESAGASAETAKQVYNDLYRVLGEDDVAVEAANHLAKLTTNQEDLAEWTDICQGVYATFGDSLPIEGLTEAANETAKTGALTGSLADALNWAGVAEDDFQAKLDACNTEAEREQLIRETLNGLYSETAQAYEKNAADLLAQNEAQAKMNESMAKIGETLAPIMAMLTELGAEILANIAPYIEQFVNEHGETIKALLIAIGEVIGNVIGWIADNWGIISTLAIVIGAISAAISIVNTVLTVYSAVQALANTQMLLAIGVVALVAAGVALLIIYWDDIVGACEGAAKAIGSALKDMGKWFSDIAKDIKKAFSDIGSWFTNIFQQARNGIQNAFSSISSWFTNIKNSIKNAFNDIGSWFSNKFSQAASGIRNAFSSIASFFADIWNKIQRTFSNIGTSIVNGITNAVKNAVNFVLSGAVNAINAAISAINGAIKLMNLIPGVNVSLVKELSVPKLAKGGIVDSATLAVVGEQGKEAVMPLENNLEWLDKLAGMLNARMGGSQPIVLQVSGKTFAEIACSSINDLTRQKGSIPLVMA